MEWLDYERQEAREGRREIIAEAVQEAKAPGQGPRGIGVSPSVSGPFSKSIEDGDGNEIFQAFTEVGDMTESGCTTGSYN